MNKLNPQEIDAIDVIKSKDEIIKYTSLDYDGVVVIHMKKH
jgi:hypothetical protein